MQSNMREYTLIPIELMPIAMRESISKSIEFSKFCYLSLDFEGENYRIFCNNRASCMCATWTAPLKIKNGMAFAHNSQLHRMVIEMSCSMTSFPLNRKCFAPFFISGATNQHRQSHYDFVWI